MLLTFPPLLALSFHSVLWAALWALLAAGGVLIAVFWRTRLCDAAPWKKCAILSLWVHVLLACLATTVRMFSAAGPGSADGEGYGPPIRVSVMALEEIESEPREAEKEAPHSQVDVAEQLAATDDADAESLEADAAPPEPTSPLQAPELLAEPAPRPEAAAEVADSPRPDVVLDEAPPLLGEGVESAIANNDDGKTQAEVVARETAASQEAGAAGSLPAPPARSRRPENLPAEYAERFADNRAEIVATRGGDERTEEAVRTALAWLAAAQSRDGRWDPARYGAGREHYVLGHDRGGAGAKADTGITGLALLAFLGAGHTHLDGPYADHVARGLDFLQRSQQADGNLCGEAELFARMYCHSMGMFALCEAYAITGDQRLAPAVRRAAEYSLAVQHPTDGGWRYRPGDTGDTSQLGWQVMALRSAEAAGLAAPEITWTRVERFLRGVERGAVGGLAAYRPEGPPTRTMTAEALYCRQLITARRGHRVAPPVADEAVRSLAAEPPSADLVNLYYWYYATLALHNAQHDSPGAAAAWDEWNRALTRTLVNLQARDGSWPETCLWGGYGGRAYTTSLAALSLEVYYRYAPGDPNRGPGVAARDEWRSVPQR